MPRKTKEQPNELNDEEKSTKKIASNAEKATTKKSTSKNGTKKAKSASKAATKKGTDTKLPKSTTSKTGNEKNKKSAVAKTAASKSKSTTNSKADATKLKESTSSKAANTKSKKGTSSKVATTKSKKSTVSKSATKKTSKKSTTKKEVEIVEYYDLPYRYNQTVVKVLAQTPTNLFIYWDISDTDRKEFEKKYGENFFEITKPVLIVHNDTLGYSFEVEINDFANSWYLHVADSKCDYRIELGRRPFEKTEKVKEDYIYISVSNEIESPNDKILFDHSQKMVYFRNVKTGKQTSKSIASMSFIQNMGKFYNIDSVRELYKLIYQNENIEEIYDLSNPSSGNPSSKFM